jgi:hypothetical protein
MNGNRIVRFVYMSNHRPRMRPKPHQQRDESPALELMPKICSLGFVYDGAHRIFLNHPPSKTGDPSRSQFTALGLTERDILLLATRPPLDDKEEIQPLRPSGSEIESLIFRVLREKCFYHCSRGNVALRPAVAENLAAGFRRRSEIEFSLRSDRVSLATGTYRALHGREEENSKPWNEMMTAGYLVNVPLGKGLPNLLAVFGMSGTTTLVWAYLLHKHSDILTQALRQPSFTMVEIQTEGILGNPVDFTFCDGWAMQVIAHCPLT